MEAVWLVDLPDLKQIINQQMKSRECLREYLSKATALMHVALENDLLRYLELVAYFYLWMLSDLLDQARELNEQDLKLLRQNADSKTSDVC